MRAPQTLILSFLFAVVASIVAAMLLGLFDSSGGTDAGGTTTSPAPTTSSTAASTTTTTSTTVFVQDGYVERLECLPAIEPPEDMITVQGDVSVRNVTAGDTDYEQSVVVADGDVVQIQMWLFDRNPTIDLRNPVVQIRFNDIHASSIVAEGRACSSNAPLLTASAVIDAQGVPVSLEFIPGTAHVRSYLDGDYRTRPASDAVFSATGESVGRVEASENPDEPHMTVSVQARVIADN